MLWVDIINKFTSEIFFFPILSSFCRVEQFYLKLKNYCHYVKRFGEVTAMSQISSTFKVFNSSEKAVPGRW